MASENQNPIIFALDVSSWDEASQFVDVLKEHVWGFKIGKELFTSMGPKVVEMVQQKGGKVFLDLKYHDIPATVGKAAAAATRLGVAMFNVHALGGAAMMRAAIEASSEVAQKEGILPPMILGVTVLTSLRDDDLQAVGITKSLDEEVTQLAKLAKQAGLHGVVASPQEIGQIRKACGDDMVIVTPGVRPKESEHHDQARVMTPGEAITAGSDYLVIGRPIKEAPDPAKAAENILEEVRSAT